MKKVCAFSLLFLWPILGFLSPALGQTPTPTNSAAATATETQFSLVQGRVRVVNGTGAIRRVIQGDKAYTGETIQVAAKAQAQVTLFDGSTLDLSSNSKLTLQTLEPPTDKAKDKIISLKLAFGKVLAKVQKLLSSKSSFEIESGGVICGVRGTSFSLAFDPKTNKLDLDVVEGKVAALIGGNSTLFTAGQQGHFLNGQLSGTGNGSNNGSGKTGGKSGTGGGTSNGTGGNNGSNNGSTNSNGNNSNANANGGTTENEGTQPSGNNANNSAPGSPAEGGTNPTNGLEPNTALGDLSNQFNSGILINSDNSLNSAQQTLTIHLVVP